MSLTLRESQAITDLAELFYDMLPWSGKATWKGHVSFKTVAEKVNVVRFWQPGSKLPMLTQLLEHTYADRRECFERLILESVRSGITYRQKKQNPITGDEIDRLNGILLHLGFKFPDLWDPEFRASLRMQSGQRAQKTVEQALAEERIRASAQTQRAVQLAELQQQFFDLSGWTDRRAAGLALEELLNRLFALEGLTPREPFRVVGEQIDGAIELDHESYLVEAKWEQAPLDEQPLLVFRGKIEGKSQYTRGIFVVINGISEQARRAIPCGKQPSFFVIDGHDLSMVLGGDIGLKEFLRQRRRLLAQEGLITVPYGDIWVGSRA